MDGSGERVGGGLSRRRPIPTAFHSVYRDGPFTECTICSAPLLPPGTAVPADQAPAEQASAEEDRAEEAPDENVLICCSAEPHSSAALYEIQKVFRGREVVFEMAICRRCGERVAQEFSPESMDELKGFLLGNFQPADDYGHCHFCAVPVSLTPSWTLVGACEGSELIVPPITLCETCAEGLEQRLSRRTREVQEDFIRDHFPGVPADLDVHPRVFGL